jgi:hypothetical protein
MSIECWTNFFQKNFITTKHSILVSESSTLSTDNRGDDDGDDSNNNLDEDKGVNDEVIGKYEDGT